MKKVSRKAIQVGSVLQVKWMKLLPSTTLHCQTYTWLSSQN